MRINCCVVNSVLALGVSSITKAEAPKIVGIAIRNENLVASILLSPKNLATVKHIPERLAPGIKARH